MVLTNSLVYRIEQRRATHYLQAMNAVFPETGSVSKPWVAPLP
jgi:hypothetical protein